MLDRLMRKREKGFGLLIVVISPEIIIVRMPLRPNLGT
jgi:hypothetical protein